MTRPLYQYPRKFINKNSRGGGGTVDRGFTLVELLCVIGILGVISAVAVPRVQTILIDAQYAAAKQDLRSYRLEIKHHFIQSGSMAVSWSGLGYESPPEDPWGNDYVYHSHKNASRGKWRKDGPVVPINSRYDLFSPGPDARWSSSIHAAVSQDDVILADDGQFIGKAADY